jgi:hypothetical protein
MPDRLAPLLAASRRALVTVNMFALQNSLWIVDQKSPRLF